MLKFRLLSTLLLLMLTFSAVKAQREVNLPKQQFKEPARPQLLRELGLTQEQIRRIRLINSENKERMREANFRLREANRNLDAAIYADNADETFIELKLREFQSAQAEIAKIRAVTELEIRKVLTPEQLIRFREMRQRFEQMRQNRRNNRQMEDFQNRPSNRKNPPFRN